MTDPTAVTLDDVDEVLAIARRVEDALAAILRGLAAPAVPTLTASTPEPGTWPIPRSWHEAGYSPRTSQLVDLTRPDFLHQCGTRRVFVVGVHQLEEAVCTRHTTHTGRHAAGNGHTITAVWED